MTKIVENALLIYTDGSLKPVGRKGGYSMVFVHVNSVGEEKIVDTQEPIGIRGTTNNRMELKACIEAIKMAPDIEVFHKVDRIVIRSDSRYVVNNHVYTLSHWPKNKWRNKDGRPIENTDLWKEFAREFRKISKRVDIEWVKGHGKGKQKDQYNVEADKLAKQSAKNPLSRYEFRSSVRRKTSPNRTRKGSVVINGQIFDVLIIEVSWMKEQKTWKYRYQVVSKDHPDCDNLDWIYSKEHLRDGHIYKVRVNENPNNPEIIEIIQEIHTKELEVK